MSAILQSMGLDRLPAYYEGFENRRSKPEFAKECPLNALNGVSSRKELRAGSAADLPLSLIKYFPF